MRNHRDEMLSLALGFALTSAVMMPPILAEQSERAERIASHDAAAGTEAVTFGKERQARLVYLLRHADGAEFDPLGQDQR